MNKKVVEALVKAGAFDFEKRPRQQLFKTIDRAVDRGAANQRDKAVGQESLFGLLDAGAPPGRASDYVESEEWTEKERLSFEKEAIGFYVSGHPLDAYQKELRRYARPITGALRARPNEKCTVAGVVAALRERPTKTGKRMAWVTLEDLSGHIELICFPGRDGNRSVMDPKTGKWGKGGPKPGFEQWELLLKSDDPILVTGTVQINSRDEQNQVVELVVEDVQSLKEVREKRVKRLELKLHADLATEERLQKLSELAKKYAGATPIAVALHMPGEAETLMETPLKVQLSDELLDAVNRLFGARVAEPG